MADEEKDGSFGTVLLAGGANLAIAIAKIVAGAVTGSSAMLAEGAHSVADTVNQLFLLTALSRSKKPADAQHPFGYGMERYFWSLLAAVGIFVLGAGFSVYEGIHSLLHPEPVVDPLVAYVVLGVSFLFEGASWLKALLQLRREAGERQVDLVRHVVTTPDPTVKTVAFEDTAALIGIVLAAAGITLHLLTGSGVWDGIASILIGVLLVGVAISLGSHEQAQPDRRGPAGGDPRRPHPDHQRDGRRRRRRRAAHHAAGPGRRARRGPGRRRRRGQRVVTWRGWPTTSSHGSVRRTRRCGTSSSTRRRPG